MTPHTRVYVKSVNSYKKGVWLKLRERVKPSPIKKELCAEFNDTSHKTTLNGSNVMKGGVA